MKAVLLGSDFMLDENGNPKILEMNTSSGIFDSMIEHLDFSGLIDLVTENQINEVHYIWARTNNEADTVNPPLDENNTLINIWMDVKLKEIFEGIGITYVSHLVNNNSITVPFIEDSDNKLILRQAYDATALIDETYCADKKGLQELIDGQEYAVPTYINADDITIDTITEVKEGLPNFITKYRNPTYDAGIFPKLHKINTVEELATLKSSTPTECYVQEFVNSTNNLYEDKYGTIRSIDIVYGPNLDMLHLGSYVYTSIIKNNTFENVFVEGQNYLDEQSRIQWLNKSTYDMLSVEYQVDDETNVIGAEGQLLGINDITKGLSLKTINFSDFPTTEGTFLQTITSTFEEMSNTLVAGTSEVVDINSSQAKSLFIKITLEDGTNWVEYPTSILYTEDAVGNLTRFKKIYFMSVGDKIILLNNNDNTLVKKEITNLEVVFTEKKVYQIDVEQTDIFLSVLDEVNNLSLIQHNYCCWNCYGYPPYNCGVYCCNNVPTCGCYGGSCFVGDSLITTQDGVKKIEDIVVGDFVKSFDFENNTLTTNQVGGLFKAEYSGGLLIINGIKTKATIGHPFAVKDINGDLKWASYDPTVDSEYHTEIDVIKLLENEHQINLNGEWITINTIELKDFTGTVYNISVNGTHNYFADNIMVHNVFGKKA
jgi:hypothetical protein